MAENGNKGPEWDEAFMRNLPPAAQRRLIRIACDMLELEVTQQYKLEPGSLLPKLPDPVESGLSPEAWRDEAEKLALTVSSPLAGITNEEELWKLHLQQQEEAQKDGEQE